MSMQPHAPDSASNSQRAMETLRSVLDEIGWSTGNDTVDESIFVDLRCDQPPVAYLHLAISREIECFVAYVVLSVRAASARRGICASHLAGVNHHIIAGSFDLD